MFALVDCNNFYASCERVFNPKLQNKPIIVLSNNDGCVIARSNQAKALGITMGVPYFKVAQLCKDHEVAVFSSNYMLYGDMSRRVMDILQTETECLEIYSIDEAFLKFSSHHCSSLLNQANALRHKILKWTGLPVSIGLAPTKTLAKVANHVAKKETTGVVALVQPQEWQPILAHMNLTDVWGIGRRSANKLLKLGIQNPLQLAQTSTRWIRQQFNVCMERTVCELNGIPCNTLESSKLNKQIIVSRSFGKPVVTMRELVEAGCCYAVRAFEKLRQQNRVTPHLQVFLSTSPFDHSKEFYTHISLYRFSQPTQDSRLACHAVTACLEKIFKAGKYYKKLGIILSQLLDTNYQTNDLFSTISMEKSEILMRAMDEINQKIGRNKLFVAAQGIDHRWKMKSERISPCYTTRWEDLRLVY